MIKYHSKVSKKRIILCSNVKSKPERVNSVTAVAFSIICKIYHNLKHKLNPFHCIDLPMELVTKVLERRTSLCEHVK